MQTLVSIITPAYHAQAFITRAVRSILSQTETNWELLIISDDGFDYHNFLKQQGIDDKRIRYFYSHGIGTGPNATRNVALAELRSSFIAPLDADDLYYPSRLERLLRLAEKSGLALDNVRVVNEATCEFIGLAFEEKPIIHFTFDEFVKSQVPLVFLFHTRLIEQGWDEDILLGADTLFNLRALEKAQFALFAPKPLHEYRVHNQSICHSADAGIRADSAYQLSLNKLAENALGFTSTEYQLKVKSMLEQKRTLNRRYMQAKAGNLVGSFQEFVAKLL